MTISKRVLLAAAALLAFSIPASAANMIGNCEVTGEKGSIPIANPAKAGQLTVEVSLPAPIWWNGDTPEAIKDGMEYCMAAEIAWRAGYDKLEVVNVGWDALIAGQTSDFDLAMSQISITDERKKIHDFSVPYFSSDIGVLVRKDAPASYHLAATLDDATDGITHVTRGVDLFAASHVHRLLQALLDLPVPVWHHHGLLIEADGRKLAKRRGSASLADLRAQGLDGRQLAEDLRNFRFPAGISLSQRLDCAP